MQVQYLHVKGNYCIFYYDNPIINRKLQQLRSKAKGLEAIQSQASLLSISLSVFLCSLYLLEIAVHSAETTI